jgi:hypothetical protein
VLILLGSARAHPYNSDSKGYMAMKTRLLLGILVVAGIVASSGRVANASIVLSYTFNGDGEARLVSVESALAYAIRLSIQGGDGLFAVLVGDEIAADGSRLPVLRIRPIDADTADAAIATEAYLTFSFQAGEESELGLRTLEFDLKKTGESAEFGCLVQSSLEGFGSGRPVLLVNPVATEHSGKIHYSVDLSGERFQDLSEVDFRVYFYSSESDEPLEFDGIQLNGEVIVAPEPGSSLVWFLMLAAILFVAAAGWTAQRNRAAWSYAVVGRGRSSTMTRRGPWPDQAREAILEIIDRGRIG